MLGPGGKDTAAARGSLRKESQKLLERFQALWLARSRPSEMRTTVSRYRKAADSLQ